MTLVAEPGLREIAGMDQSDIRLLRNLKAAGSRTSPLHEHFDLIQEAWEVFALGSPLITRALQEKGVIQGGSPSNVQAFIERQRKAGRLGKKGCRSGDPLSIKSGAQAAEVPATIKSTKSTKPAVSKTRTGGEQGQSTPADTKMQVLGKLERLFSDSEE